MLSKASLPVTTGVLSWAAYDSCTKDTEQGLTSWPVKSTSWDQIKLLRNVIDIDLLCACFTNNDHASKGTTDASIWRQRRMGTSVWLMLVQRLLPLPPPCWLVLTRSLALHPIGSRRLTPCSCTAPRPPRALLAHRAASASHLLAHSTQRRAPACLACAAAWTRVSFHMFCWVFEA
jgi:hypothetical protein